MSDVFRSIFSSAEAFVYRCKNDKDYTMEYMEGSVETLVGYKVDEIVGNKVTSFANLMVREDVERVFEEVDAAIDAKKSWNVFYHLTHKSGKRVPVRELGSAVYEDGELVYLQGLVACARAEKNLTQDIEHMLVHTKSVNTNIISLTGEITKSLQMLDILSINARVEAARLGQAGAGFGVVANEIKALADRNRQLAGQITQKVNEKQPSSRVSAVLGVADD